jgi:hypothetical protein
MKIKDFLQIILWVFGMNFLLLHLGIFFVPIHI